MDEPGDVRTVMRPPIGRAVHLVVAVVVSAGLLALVAARPGPSAGSRAVGVGFLAVLVATFLFVWRRPLIVVEREVVALRWFSFGRSNVRVARAAVAEVRRYRPPHAYSGAWWIDLVGIDGVVLATFPTAAPLWRYGGPWTADDLVQLTRSLAVPFVDQD